MSDTQTIVNAKTLATLFNLSIRRIYQLAGEGIIPRADKGKYPLIECVQAYIKYLQSLSLGPGGPIDLHSERTRLVRANADKSELELASMRGDFLPAQVVRVVWQDQVAAFRAKMLSVPTKLAAELIGIESKKQIEAITKRHIWEALGELSEHGGDYARVATALQDQQDRRSAPKLDS